MPDPEPSRCSHDDSHRQMLERCRKAERLLAEIEHGKHSIPGVLKQIGRYFDEQGISSIDALGRRD